VTNFVSPCCLWTTLFSPCFDAVGWEAQRHLLNIYAFAVKHNWTGVTREKNTKYTAAHLVKPEKKNLFLSPVRSACSEKMATRIADVN